MTPTNNTGGGTASATTDSLTTAKKKKSKRKGKNKVSSFKGDVTVDSALYNKGISPGKG